MPCGHYCFLLVNNCTYQNVVLAIPFKIFFELHVTSYKICYSFQHCHLLSSCFLIVNWWIKHLGYNPFFFHCKSYHNYFKISLQSLWLSQLLWISQSFYCRNSHPQGCEEPHHHLEIRVFLLILSLSKSIYISFLETKSIFFFSWGDNLFC